MPSEFPAQLEYGALICEGVDDLAHVVNAQPVFGNEMAQVRWSAQVSPSRAPGNS